MTAILVADVWDRSRSDLAGSSPAPASAAKAGEVLADLVGLHGGTRVRSRGNAWVVLFDAPVRAIECALAVQSRLAERNRAPSVDRTVVARISVHHVDKGDSNGDISAHTYERAASLGALTPYGRVFVSRPIYLQARVTRLFAFIPLGTGPVAGDSEPIDVFEAVALAGRSWMPAADAHERQLPMSAESPELLGRSAIVPASVTGWTLVALSAGAFFAISRALSTLLIPMEILTYIFHEAGVSLFGAAGSQSAAALGGLLVPLAMPTVAAFHYVRENHRSRARWSIFWIGQSFLSLGQSVLSAPEPESFAAAQRDGLLQVLGGFGALASARRVAQFALLAGCLLIAAVVVAALGLERRRTTLS